MKNHGRTCDADRSIAFASTDAMTRKGSDVLNSFVWWNLWKMFENKVLGSNFVWPGTILIMVTHFNRPEDNILEKHLTMYWHKIELLHLSTRTGISHHGQDDYESGIRIWPSVTLRIIFSRINFICKVDKVFWTINKWMEIYGSCYLGYN